MIDMNLQLFGGRGASSSGGGATGGVDVNLDIESTTSLISAEGKRNEINQTLQVLKDVYDDYGIDVQDARLATLKGASNRAMAYYDSNGNLAVNQKYFDSGKMDAAYDRCVDKGFHPSRGNKTGMEAVVAHEMGHRLTDALGEKNGDGRWALDKTANNIVKEAAKNAGYKDTNKFISKISGYASKNRAEAVAEAFSDVYCNGSKAKRESRAIVDVLNKGLRR